MDQQYILRIQCTDQKGLVHKITGVLYHHGLIVIRTDEFVDQENGQFLCEQHFWENAKKIKL